MSKIYFIEAGHGGNDPGAIAYDGTTEESLNRELRDMVIKRLTQRQCEGVSLDGSAINIEQDNDRHRLWQTVRNVNAVASRKDFLLSIHFNFNHPTATGTEVFYSPATSQENISLARRLSGAVAKAQGIRNRGVKLSTSTRFGKLAILDDVKPRALLLEVCFLNEHDLTAYRANKEKVADEIVRCILIGK